MGPQWVILEAHRLLEVEQKASLVSFDTPVDIRDAVLSLVSESVLPLHLFVIGSKEGRVLVGPMSRIVEGISVVSHGRLRVNLEGVLAITDDGARRLDRGRRDARGLVVVVFEEGRNRRHKRGRLMNWPRRQLARGLLRDVGDGIREAEAEFFLLGGEGLPTRVENGRIQGFRGRRARA